MKLELKHLAPYLPYELPIEPIYKSTYMGGYNQRILDTSILDNYGLEEIKPIVRPLSDLMKHECYELLSNNLRFNIDMLGFPNCLDLKVNDYNILLENHFDIFGLIEQDLAVDINTLKKMKTEQEIRFKLKELEDRYNSDKVTYACLCSNIALLKYILNDK